MQAPAGHGLGYICAAAVGEVNEQLAVLRQLGVCGGVRVGLQRLGRAVFRVQGIGRDAAAVPAPLIAAEVIAVLQHSGVGDLIDRRVGLDVGGNRLRRIAFVQLAAGRLFPIIVDLIPIIVHPGLGVGVRGQYFFIFDEEELCVEANARAAGQGQALAVELPLAGVLQVLAVEPGILVVERDFAEHADLKGNDRVVEAQAAEGVDIGVQAQRGEVIGDILVVHRVVPLLQHTVVHPLLIKGLYIEVDGNSRAEAQLRRDGNGADRGVEHPLVAHAAAHGKAAGVDNALPFSFLVIINDLALIIAGQLIIEPAVAALFAGGVFLQLTQLVLLILALDYGKLFTHGRLQLGILFS